VSRVFCSIRGCPSHDETRVVLDGVVEELPSGSVFVQRVFNDLTEDLVKEGKLLGLSLRGGGEIAERKPVQTTGICDW
jgi:hypothetical protein